MTSFRKLTLIVLACAISVFAADVDGQWTGTFATPNGEVPVNFAFKADGDKLTGTTSGPAGEIAIANGKVDGNKVSFSVTFDFGGMPFTMNYSGVVSTSEIKFTIDIFGMPVELVVKKSA
jgi:hypothetical protein